MEGAKQFVVLNKEVENTTTKVAGQHQTVLSINLVI